MLRNAPVYLENWPRERYNAEVLNNLFCHAGTVLDLFDHHAMAQAKQTAYTFLPNGEWEHSLNQPTAAYSIAYGQLQQRAQAWGARLQAQGLAGKPVLLMFPAGLDFIVAFLACWYAGAIAVPCVLARNSRHFQRVAHVLQDCGSTQLLTTQALQASLVQGFAKLPASFGASQICVDVEHSAQATWSLDVRLRPQPHHLAFLQYTSGSTGQPKGVAVTHGQLLANERCIQASSNAPWGVRVAGWLPQYHDMGLVGNVLLPLTLGGQLCFFSPLHFIQRPLRWLRLLSQHQTQISTAPNFALAMCNRLPWQDLQSEHLDFSALQTIYCGSEPIDASTLLEFESRLKPFGLKPGTVQACYGMAESTLMLTGGHGHQPRVLSVCRASLADNKVELLACDGSSSNAGLSIVNCGQTLQGHRVVVVNPNTHEICEENEVGELWAQGPSIAQGYWGSDLERMQLNQATFAATVQGNNTQDCYLRTGDLGFMYQGCVYVTGRIKDLVIVRGCNYYPQDIERTLLEASPHFVGAAVFSVPGVDGQEAVATAIELSKQGWVNLPHIKNQDWQNAQAAVLAEHGLALQGVHWLSPRALPRTSSGKVQRHACQKLYLQELS